jgi:hypothetical protein
MTDFADRFSTKTFDRMLVAVRNGLGAIERIDVHLLYTNIVLKDICISCLGGELVGDREIAERGYLKMRRWFERTRRSGMPTEYNSPTYTTLALEVLGRLSTTTVHDETRVLSALAGARLAVSAALRINPVTRRWAGPFGRAYRDVVLADGPPEIGGLEELIESGLVPSWIDDVINRKSSKLNVAETSDVDSHTVVSTHHSKSFSFGVASRELSTQANRFIATQSQVVDLRYPSAKLGRVATMTTRYLHDDMWLSKYRVTPSRAAGHVFSEEGGFSGAQRGAAAIGVATSGMLGAERSHSRAHLAIIWTQAESVEKIYVNGQLVTSLPCEVPANSDICFETESLLVGVRVIDHTALGTNAPVRLTEREGMIVLEIHNYLGPEKTFWELANPGAFFHGLPYCAFYTEVAERDEWVTPEEFIAAFSGGVSTADLEEEVGLGLVNERVLTTAYSRDGNTLGVELDLVSGELVRRFTEDGDMGLPKMESEVAVHSDVSPIEVGGAKLEFGSGDAWLLAVPDSDLWVAGVFNEQGSEVLLTTERGQKRIPGISAGLIVWRGDDFAVTAGGSG